MKISSTTMTRISLMTSVLCILGPFTFPIGPIPFSLTGAGIYLCIYLLGPKEGGASILIYLMIGMAGLPVFSGFTAGPGRLFGPTGGYLMGYIPAAVSVGLWLIRIEKGKRKRKEKFNFCLEMINLMVGNMILYTCGTVWLMISGGLSLKESIFTGIIPFFIPDLIKSVIIIILARQLKRRLKDISFD